MLNYFLSFSTGVICVSAIVLLHETIEGIGSVGVALAIAIGGAGIVRLISGFIPEYHHHHVSGEHERPCHAHSTRAGAHRMFIGDMIHSIGDGLLITIAFSSGVHTGVVATIAILIHEVVQESAEFAVFRAAGYSVASSFIRIIISSSTIFIGIIIGFLTVPYHTVNAVLLGVSAGVLASVAIQDLLPTIIRTSLSERRYAYYVLFFSAGLVTMTAVQQLLPHVE